jgi:AcrR family transcriptional regulator
MELKSSNTEQAILEAAEKIFIQKGYTEARTTEIAEAAGVNNALLHYYFRTKEALFERIFLKKATQMVDCFVIAFDSDLPFFEKLKSGIENHFDGIAQDPGLPFFILREIIQNEERKQFIHQRIVPIAYETIERISILIRKEIDRGTIRPVNPRDLLLNIVSLNVFSFIALQVFFDEKSAIPSQMLQSFLEERKKNNVETIINSIKI